ncbi:ADP-ribosylglycohydrolase family protein [uncultured Microbulbifer sp.]|uniref:ADP-ribosylglycohydrolase family protein n=1 Tax=uncultured Microbulbifer sp. TaxID=348147 RepID=UPI00261C57EA|nr:ADP-ribosylglycohydrolase family protein [uncultured Microbulbifer sp.]
MNFNVLDKVKGCLVGLACGDAVGTTLEFKRKGEFTPISDMVGGGPFGLEKGQWTDDTSMALCLAHSLLLQEGFCAIDQMNRYCNWYQYGYMSSTGVCFDIGATVQSALIRYLETGNPFSGSVATRSSGNGSLMRLAPVPIFFLSLPSEAIHYSGESSRTTHGSTECIESCRFFCDLILSVFNGTTKDNLLHTLEYTPNSEKVFSIAKGEFLQQSYEELTGSGYVIESLISALWCFFNTDSFHEAILLAANIGNDADTTAAICGQIAGAYYGISGIPEEWQQQICWSEDIILLAENLYRTGLLVSPQ